MSLQQSEKINIEKETQEDEFEELETHSVDGSSFSEPIMNSSIAKENNDAVSNDNDKTNKEEEPFPLGQMSSDDS